MSCLIYKLIYILTSSFQPRPFRVFAQSTTIFTNAFPDISKSASATRCSTTGKYYN